MRFSHFTHAIMACFLSSSSIPERPPVFFPVPRFPLGEMLL